ncbi:M28 family peptidase [bacterium]|nr:M28 family peptidase [bacterium]
MTRSRILSFLILCVISACVYFFFFRKSNALDNYANDLEDLIIRESIAANMKVFAAKPHRAGTPENHAVGHRIMKELQSSGATVSTTEYSVELPEPGSGSLFLTAPDAQEIPYSEKVFQQDPYTTLSGQEKPYFAYIPDSDIEGEIIYANYGDRADYEYLKQQGISVAGKIALVRAQGSCRGMKQMIAEEEGLSGLLLFPEPKDHGFRKQPYPGGPGLHSLVAQRGSMLKFFVYPGDPFTAVKDEREPTLPTVAALPVTTEAAELLFQRLDGISNSAWKGWLSNSYPIGPGPARVRIQYQSRRESKKIRNIFGRIEGTNTLEPALMVSCHYDAWIYGASDPGSGTAAVLETAKALLQLRKNGWKPKRDILFAFWDAEEYGMIGSTNWVHHHLPQARGGIANLLFVDSVRGPVFSATLLPGLRGLLDDVLKYCTDPNTGKSVLEFHTQYDMPGFSDDTIPFSNLAGVPLGQLNYGIHYPMYHSIYDNLTWMERFGDPGYSYAANLSRILALYAIRLTNEDRLPFRFSEFATHYEKQLSKVLLENMQGKEQTAQINELIATVKEVGALGAKLETDDIRRISAENRKRMNTFLLQASLSFTEEPGKTTVPFRYRNVVAGPSPDNECAGIELPGLNRALRQNSKERLHHEMDRLHEAFLKSKEYLQQAVSVLDSRSGR